MPQKKKKKKPLARERLFFTKTLSYFESSAHTTTIHVFDSSKTFSITH